MNQINARIRIRPHRLNIKTETIHARQLHSFVAEFLDIPDDVTSVSVRVFKADGVSFFDIPVSRSGNSPTKGLAYIIGTCFPTSCDSRYEIHAYDARGNMTSLGEGLLAVEPFTTTGSPTPPGQSVPIMQISDSTGALHTIQAVPDDDGAFTTIIDA